MNAASILSFLCFSLIIPPSAEAIDSLGLQGRIPRAVPQGGAFVVRLKPTVTTGDLRGSLNDRQLIFSADGRGRMQALVGIDLEAAGQRQLRLEAPDRQGRVRAREWTIRVTPRRFTVQRLTLPQHMVDLDPDTSARVTRETDRLKELWKRVTPERLLRGPFLSPVQVPHAPEGFGHRRIINNQPRAPHSGADYKAPPGSVVVASNAGRVALAEEQFFAGNAVVLDHGLGLYTAYFHLQTILVKAGDIVTKGQEIGRVGATGRATGPHLHFGVRLQGARIDPAALFRLPLP